MKKPQPVKGRGFLSVLGCDVYCTIILVIPWLSDQGQLQPKHQELLLQYLQ